MFINFFRYYTYERDKSKDRGNKKRRTGEEGRMKTKGGGGDVDEIVRKGE